MVEEEQEPEESVLTEYDPDDFLSGAINSLDSTIPLDFLEFEYPFDVYLQSACRVNLTSRYFFLYRTRGYVHKLVFP